MAGRRRLLGAALAIAHALAAPNAVSGLRLRAVFLVRGGADEPTQTALAIAWWRRGQSLAGSPVGAPRQRETITALLDRYHVQSHCLRHACWLDPPPLLDRAVALPRVPTLLRHGVEDRVCLPEGAMALHARLLHSTLSLVPGADHDPSHPAMAAAPVRALTAYADHAAWPQPPAP